MFKTRRCHPMVLKKFIVLQKLLKHCVKRSMIFSLLNYLPHQKSSRPRFLSDFAFGEAAEEEVNLFFLA